MINVIEVIAAFIIAIIIAIFLFQFMGRYIYNYRITNSGIEIVLLRRIPVKRISFSNIAEIRKTSFKEVLPFKSSEMFLALRFGNRIWGQVVLVRPKRGVIKIILITPDNADSFIKEVLLHLSENHSTPSSSSPQPLHKNGCGR